MSKEYKNNNIYVRVSERDKDIYFKDLTDVWNDTSAYTTKKRSFKKASEYIDYMFSTELKEELKFKHIREVLNTKFNMSVHTYCAMD